jgi:uncharacterized membrane protein
MNTNRLEMFSDGVIAILITIMVLELQIPHGSHLEDLRELWPVFLTYVLSFVYLGIYWNNHHHMLQATEQISGSVMWANLHLLFWLSLVPFCTGWMGENHFAETPTAAYGVVLLMAAVAYSILQWRIVHEMGSESALAQALGRDVKGKLSIVFYAAAIVLAFVEPWIALGLYALVAAMWLVPDRRVESLLRSQPTSAG